MPLCIESEEVLRLVVALLSEDGLGFLEGHFTGHDLDGLELLDRVAHRRRLRDR